MRKVVIEMIRFSCSGLLIQNNIHFSEKIHKKGKKDLALYS